MGLDNVPRRRGCGFTAAFLLVVLGLLISIPIVGPGAAPSLCIGCSASRDHLRGPAVLAMDVAKMVLGEPLLKPWAEASAGYSWSDYMWLPITGVMLAGGSPKGR